MSIYKNYINYISTIINQDKQKWKFKRDSRYTYMLEHVSPELGNQCLTEIQNRYTKLYINNKDLLIQLCHINDLYGEPNKINFKNFTLCSSSNLRYILHSFILLTYATNCSLNNLDIIEIGGGYGGLCFYISKLSSLFNIKIKSYVIFDLLEASKLQKKYLETLSINDINYYQINNFKDLKNNSFLVSTYAFSEIQRKFQIEYTKKILNPYISHGFIAWNAIPTYKFINNKIIEEEVSFPSRPSSYSKFVYFKPKDN